MELDIADAIGKYGFPIVASFGMGAMVFYIWKWVTTEIKPVISSAQKTLIGLVDRIRMLDNDMIRLNTKLQMVLEYHEKNGIPINGELEEIVKKYASNSTQFNQDINRNKSK
jgi:hypothetical protein